MQAVNTLSPSLGIFEACEALNVPRSRPVSLAPGGLTASRIARVLPTS